MRMKGLPRSSSLRLTKAMSARSVTRIRRENIRLKKGLPCPGCKHPVASLPNCLLVDSRLLVVRVRDGQCDHRQRKERSHSIQRLQIREVVEHNLESSEGCHPEPDRADELVVQAESQEYETTRKQQPPDAQREIAGERYQTSEGILRLDRPANENGGAAQAPHRSDGSRIRPPPVSSDGGARHEDIERRRPAVDQRR